MACRALFVVNQEYFFIYHSANAKDYQKRWGAPNL
jgi:hypothetical protein